MKTFLTLYLMTLVAYGQWSEDMLQPLDLGSGIQPQLAAVSGGGLYAAWLSEPDFNVYLQYLDASGTEQWDRDGRLISDQTNETWIAVFHLNLLADTEGNAIVSTVDARSGTWQIYAYKFNQSGQAVWGGDGLTLSATGQPNISPRITLLPEDNSVIVSWTDNYTTVRLQRIAADGTLLWGDAGIHLTDPGASILSPQTVRSDAGTVLVQYIRQTGSFPALSSQIIENEYSLAGELLWSSAVIDPGVGFPLGNWSQDLITDGMGGSYSSWTELTGVNQTAKLRHLDGDGELSWAGAVEGSTQSSHFRVGPRLARGSDSQDVYMAWTESDANQNNRGIFAQRITSTGNRAWGEGGLPIEALDGDVFMDLNLAHAESDLIACYIKEASASSAEVYAARLANSGSFVWDNQRIAVTASGFSKSDLTLTSGSGCYFISWVEEDRIRSHCLRADGSLGAPPAEAPGLIHVPADFSTIQAAIENAIPGDTVLVEPGFYRENINFLGKDILLASLTLTTGDTSYIAQTILDGGGLEAVVVFENGETAAARLLGFTIQNGTGHYADPDGDGNSSHYGGGIYCFESSPSLSDLRVQDNTVSGGGGGGLFCYHSNATLTRIRFQGNLSDDVGGAIYARSNSDLIISDSEFWGNQCSDVGGALYARDSSDIILDRVLVIGNTSLHAGAGVGFKNGCRPLLTSITFSGNQAAHFGGALYSNSSYSRVINSILWNNGDNEVHFADFDDPSEVLLAYSNIQGGEEGITTNDNGTIEWLEGNLEQDPLFSIPSQSNYELSLNSPARDAGTDYFQYLGETLVELDPESYLGLAPDMGALEAQPDTVYYFPLETDLQWTYTSPTDTFTITILDSTHELGQDLFWFDAWYQGEPGLNPFTVAGNQVLISYGDVDVLLYDFAATLGTSWTIPATEFEESTMTLIGMNDTVMTSMGTFVNCYHFNRFIADDWSYDEWFAPAIGLVQRDVITLAGPQRYGLSAFGPATGIDPRAEKPQLFTLSANYPNPFNPRTRISYTMVQATHVSLSIHDLRGKELVVLQDGLQRPGQYVREWNGLDSEGRQMPSGIYLYTLKTGKTASTRKMMLLK